MPASEGYNGTYRATVVPPPAGFSGQWVIVPRLNGDSAMGPVQSTVGGSLTHGSKVVVTTIAGIKDDLVIIGKFA